LSCSFSLEIYGARPAQPLLNQPLLAFIAGYLKIAEARVQQKPGSLKSKAFGDRIIIEGHGKLKPSEFCYHSIAVLVSDASRWFPLSNPGRAAFR